MVRQTRDKLPSQLATGQLTLDEWDAIHTEYGRVYVIDVIADVTGKTYQYATNVYNRLCTEQRIQQCEIRPLPPKQCLSVTQGSSYLIKPIRCDQRIGRGGAKPTMATPIATTTEMVQIVWQLPGTAEFRKDCCALPGW